MAQREDNHMLDIIGRLLNGVLQFYAWTVGAGILALILIMLVEGATDLLRERWRAGWHAPQSIWRRRT